MSRRKAYHKGWYTEQIFCANCKNAKRVLRRQWRSGETIEKVCCQAGEWEKKANGKGAYVDFFAVWSRTRKNCDFYTSMSDDPSDLDDFLDTLPQNRVDYEMIREGSCSLR